MKAKLTADHFHNLTWVDVDTNAGTIYLGGTAATEAQKARASELAQNVAGVKKVVNNIQVKSGSTSTASSASPGAFQGRHSMSGEVTSVNRNNGHLTLKTGEGSLMLHSRPAALANVKSGNRVTVEPGVRPGE